MTVLVGKDVGVMATSWDMYDMFEEAAASEGEINFVIFCLL